MATASRIAEAPPLALAPRVPLLLIGGLILIAVAAVGLLQVMQTSRTATIGYDLRALERERLTLGAEVRLLETDIAQMSRIEQIREQASARLGMVPPERTLQLAVGVPAPQVIALPERYVAATAEIEPAPVPWWERLLSRLPGFD